MRSPNSIGLSPRQSVVSVRSNDLPGLGIDEDVDLATTGLDLDDVNVPAPLLLDRHVGDFSGYSLNRDPLGVSNRNLGRRRLLLRGFVAQLPNA